MTNFKVPYVEFMKHAQKVVREPAIKTRPVLGGVYHHDNTIAVTDSHRLYYATNMNEGAGEARNVSPITGAEINEGEFPDITRLIPEEGSEEQLTAIYDVTKLYDYVRAIEIISRINKTSDILALEFDSDYFSIKTVDEITDGVAKYVEGTRKPDNIKTIYANIKYVKEALMLLRDAKAEKVEIKYYGNNRPFTLSSGNLLTLIMPIRKGA